MNVRIHNIPLESLRNQKVIEARKKGLRVELFNFIKVFRKGAEAK